MLDLFVIFSKGGIVFWCFQGPEPAFSVPVNSLIKTVILQERGALNGYNHKSLRLQYKLDNEFELVFVIGYQSILQLSYIDKLLDDIQRAFAERYRSVLERGSYDHKFDFDEDFDAILKQAEEEEKAKATAPKKMKSFGESRKFTKTREGSKLDPLMQKNETKGFLSSFMSSNGSEEVEEPDGNSTAMNGDKVKEKLAKLGKRGLGGRRVPAGKPKKPIPSTKPVGTDKKVKMARIWETGGTKAEMGGLDHSKEDDNASLASFQNGSGSLDEGMLSMVGKMKGELQSVGEEDPSSEEEEEETDTPQQPAKKASGLASGVFSFFKGLAGGKTLTKESIHPVLEKMKEHLITKNVAANISEQLCDSVAMKLEGKVLGTFTRVASTVKSALQESLMQILSPRRRIDILRDIMESKKKSRPYVVTFCGVNGVGKSTNLAKICFWLLENGLRVLIAACDTFRAGAVEQLRTHRQSLSSLHPPANEGDPEKVMLYEKGYGKDSAAIAMDAIKFARESHFDVVLVDTAGRMQDNEPLMRALAKLNKINTPDLVLFVGEALVGNEAVDQLKKFNRALADFSDHDNPHLIDGILLTKFDTIDDKVGAAISMTYTTGQPILFVGTGQTYTDLKSLNARSVVHALLKA